MSLHEQEFTEHYLPKTDTQNLICSVLIGDGQQGSYTILLGGHLLAIDHAAVLGKKSEVLGKYTDVIAHITDVLKETNWTSVTVRIHEGTAETRFGPYKFKVPAEHDEVDFFIRIQHS